MPPLLKLSDTTQYRAHYEQTLCQGGVYTHDGIPVYFKKEDFDHAFFESTLRNGIKDSVLSITRAERMDLISATLMDSAADRFQGWNKKQACYDPTRCVSVVHGEFVVVIRISKKKDNSLKANFVTCYVADNSINKIRRSPPWSKQDCLDAL